MTHHPYDYYIGIDPGVTGAIAILSGEAPIAPTSGQSPSPLRGNQTPIALHHCPLITKADDQRFNRHDVTAMLKLLPKGKTIAVLESVHFDWRDDGKKGSAEVLIRSHEAWLTLLISTGAEIRSLTCEQWRAMAGCKGIGADKERLTMEACRQFPSVRQQLKRRSTRAKVKGFVYEHGLAEALLMASVARSIGLGEVAASAPRSKETGLHASSLGS